MAIRCAVRERSKSHSAGASAAPAAAAATAAPHKAKHACIDCGSTCWSMVMAQSKESGTDAAQQLQEPHGDARSCGSDAIL